jgi:hypothetical protein
VFLLTLFRCAAAEFHAAPGGSARGDGSEQAPWDLQTAFEPSNRIRPGDTLWLRDGTYTGGFTCQLRGRAGLPITIRQFPGERAIIDCRGTPGSTRPPLFDVAGDHLWFWGFEVTCSDPTRVTEITGSHPRDILRGGIHCRGSHIRFINLVVHDTAQGFGFWSEGEGGEIYGCLIYHNGWKGPDRGHGHAIYSQNKRGIKRLVDNIFFNQFGYGIHIYGSSKASLQGYEILGNAGFNNGAANGEHEVAPSLHIGGGAPARGISVVSNYIYQAGLGGVTARFGYSAANRDLLCRDNYFVGHTKIESWERVSMLDNTFVGDQSVLSLTLPAAFQRKNYVWDGNDYFAGASRYPPLHATRNREAVASGWEEWQEKARLDLTGEFARGRPAGTKVFIRPNRYEPGRAHVIVYNWDRLPEVEADLSTALKPGDGYQIVSAQDYFGAPLARGEFDGKPITLPMRRIPLARPVGMTDFVPPASRPEFDVFVVRPAEPPKPKHPVAAEVRRRILP